LNEYTFTDLSVGEIYELHVTAVNDIGESEVAPMTLLAASVPQKLAEPLLVESTATSVQIQAVAAFDGGDDITAYIFIRDDGPLSSYQSQVSQAEATYTFEDLQAGQMYRLKVAAVNSIG
jgi:hypothetical protein